MSRGVAARSGKEVAALGAGVLVAWMTQRGGWSDTCRTGDGVWVLVMGAGGVTVGSVSRAGWTTVDDERDGSGAVGYPAGAFGTSGPEVTQAAERQVNTSDDVTSKLRLVRVEAKRVLLVRKARSCLARHR